jgi:hypothetical protein
VSIDLNSAEHISNQGTGGDQAECDSTRMGATTPEVRRPTGAHGLGQIDMAGPWLIRNEGVILGFHILIVDQKEDGMTGGTTLKNTREDLAGIRFATRRE